jgi:8-oxo-dGTP pyrophosphatase MutT (NUDIX family)
MRLLFIIDKHDYDINGQAFVRSAARSIIIKNNKIAMIHSIRYDYYKFPGGGIEPLESREEALIRETLEESGLRIIPSSIREYGYVQVIQKGRIDDIFIQDNYYYLCDVREGIEKQKLDKYEDIEEFTLDFVYVDQAIMKNRNNKNNPKLLNMLERETRVLELLKKEGHVKG